LAQGRYRQVEMAKTKRPTFLSKSEKTRHQQSSMPFF
jgi:hypothetical protein